MKPSFMMIELTISTSFFYQLDYLPGETTHKDSEGINVRV